MKTNNIKWIAVLFSALMLFQSCKVYHNKTASVDEVIESQKKVKVKTNSNETYEFDRLQREENLIYAYTKIRSRTAEKLSDNGLEGKLDGKYLKFQLLEETIKEYHLHNKALSIIIGVVVPAIIFCGVMYLIALGSVNTGSLAF